jgi:two-component system sensor histidine kinase/response regulator
MESNRKMLRILLKRSGVDADLAENGEVAVEMVLAAPDKYEVVFMDKQMPVMVRADELRTSPLLSVMNTCE